MSEYDDLLDDTDQYIDDTGDLDNGLASNLLDAEEDTFNDETFGADVEEITADDWEQDTEQFTKFQQEIQNLQGTVHIAPVKLQDQSNNFNDLGYSTSNIKAGDANNFDINSNDDSELDLSKVLNFSIDDDESVTDHILFEANNSSHIAAFGSGQDFFMMNNGPMQNQGWAPTNIKPNVVPPANHHANQIPLQEAQRASNDFISLEDLEKQLAGASLHENYAHNQPTNNHISESAKPNNVKLMGTNAQIPIQVGPNHRTPYYGQPIKIFPNTQLPSNIQQRPSPQMFSPNRVNPPMSQHQLQHLQSPLQPRVGVPLQPKFIGSEMMTDEEIISIIQQQQGQLQAAMTNPYVEDYYYLNYTANKNPDRPRILPPNINFTSSQENNFNSSTPPNHQFKLLGRIASQNIRTPRQLVQLDEGQNVVTKTPDGSVANKSTGSKYGVLYAIEEGLALLLDMHDIVTSLPHTAQVYQKELKSKLAINYSKILALLRITPSPSELYEGAFIVSVCQHNKGINLLRRLLSHSLYLIINLPNLTNQIFVVFYAYLHSLKDIRGVAYKNGNKESFGSLCSTVHEFVNKYFQGEFSQFQSSPSNMVDPNTINFALHKNSFLLSQLCGILGFVTMTVVNNRKDSSEVAPLLQFKEGIELLALVFMKANELKNYSMNPQEWAMVFNQFFDVSHTNFSNMLRLLTQNNDTEDHPEIWQLLTLVSQNCDVARRSVLISELRFFFAQFNSDDEMKPGMVMFLQTLQAN